MRVISKTDKFIAWLKWFFVYVPLGIFATLTSPIVCVPIFLLSFLGRFNPLYWVFWFWMDKEIYNDKTNADWKVYKKGNIFRWYIWHGIRNTMWNVKRSLKPKKARENCKWNKEIILEVIKDSLTRNGEKISIHENCLEVAGFKWITKSGEEGWHVFSGEKMSKKYSNIGTVFIWYEALGSIYPRFSSAEPIKLFGKRYWIYFAIGASDKRYLLNFKIYKYQKLH